MKKIAQGNNPHVVNMIGCVTLQEPLCLITEFVKYGDLLSYLRMSRKKTDGEDPYLELQQLESNDLLSFAYQIASGMVGSNDWSTLSFSSCRNSWQVWA